MRRYCPVMGKTLEEDDVFTWLTDCFYEVFQTGTVNGARLLDIGTGPNIYSVVSATSYCDSIILSDLVARNREVLTKWLDGTSQNGFRHIFQYVVDKEGKGELPDELEQKLKSKIAAILPVNLLQEQPFAPCHLSKFNIITSSYCVESATTDYGEYKKMVSRIMSLLETGGHLFLCSGLGCNFYTVRGVHFKTCCLSSKQIKSAWTECGLALIACKEEDFTECDDDDDSTGIFFMYGRKLI